MKQLGIFLSILLAGCDDTHNSSPLYTSPLIGTWITESCEQAVDINMMPIDTWVKGLYKFTDQGTIQVGKNNYYDSDCINLSFSYPPYERINPNEHTKYVDNGELLLQEGINGNSLLIENSLSFYNKPLSFFFTIHNNILCFSDAIKFEAQVFSITTDGSESINFINCLIKA